MGHAGRTKHARAPNWPPQDVGDDGTLLVLLQAVSHPAEACCCDGSGEFGCTGCQSIAAQAADLVRQWLEADDAAKPSLLRPPLLGSLTLALEGAPALLPFAQACRCAVGAPATPCAQSHDLTPPPLHRVTQSLFACLDSSAPAPQALSLQCMLWRQLHGSACAALPDHLNALTASLCVGPASHTDAQRAVPALVRALSSGSATIRAAARALCTACVCAKGGGGIAFTTALLESVQQCLLSRAGSRAALLGQAHLLASTVCVCSESGAAQLACADAMLLQGLMDAVRVVHGAAKRTPSTSSPKETEFDAVQHSDSDASAATHLRGGAATEDDGDISSKVYNADFACDCSAVVHAETAPLAPPDVRHAFVDGLALVLGNPGWLGCVAAPQSCVAALVAALATGAVDSQLAAASVAAALGCPAECAVHVQLLAEWRLAQLQARAAAQSSECAEAPARVLCACLRALAGTSTRACSSGDLAVACLRLPPALAGGDGRWSGAGAAVHCAALEVIHTPDTADALLATCKLAVASLERAADSPVHVRTAATALECLARALRGAEVPRGELARVGGCVLAALSADALSARLPFTASMLPAAAVLLVALCGADNAFAAAAAPALSLRCASLYRFWALMAGLPRGADACAGEWSPGCLTQCAQATGRLGLVGLHLESAAACLGEAWCASVRAVTRPATQFIEVLAAWRDACRASAAPVLAHSVLTCARNAFESERVRCPLLRCPACDAASPQVTQLLLEVIDAAARCGDSCASSAAELCEAWAAAADSAACTGCRSVDASWRRDLRQRAASWGTLTKAHDASEDEGVTGGVRAWIERNPDRAAMWEGIVRASEVGAAIATSCV